MTLEERILNDFNEARKNRDELRSSSLSYLRAQMKNAAIEKLKRQLDDQEVISIIKKLVKQRQDSIEQFQKGGRQDLVDKESKEKDILAGYLPALAGEGDIKAMVEQVIQEQGVKDIKGMGAVMKEVLGRFQGAADSKLVSEIVKARLAGK